MAGALSRRGLSENRWAHGLSVARRRRRGRGSGCAGPVQAQQARRVETDAQASKEPVAGRGPPVGDRNGVDILRLEGSGRYISGGGNPVKERGPWAVAHLRVVTPLRRSRSGS